VCVRACVRVCVCVCVCVCGCVYITAWAHGVGRTVSTWRAASMAAPFLASTTLRSILTITNSLARLPLRNCVSVRSSAFDCRSAAFASSFCRRPASFASAFATRASSFASTFATRASSFASARLPAASPLPGAVCNAATGGAATSAPSTEATRMRLPLRDSQPSAWADALRLLLLLLEPSAEHFGQSCCACTQHAPHALHLSCEAAEAAAHRAQVQRGLGSVAALPPPVGPVPRMLPR
jgi:hypothetical protein